MTRPTVKHRATAQGSAVRAVLAQSAGFRSAQDIYAQLRSEGQSVGMSTVYRHLQALADEGLADLIYTPEGETTYRLCGESHTSHHHHHHLVCKQCGRAEEVEGRAVERWASEVAEKFGFIDVDHTVEVFGICGDCATSTPSKKEPSRRTKT